MPAGRGNDAERFAAALEQGRSPGSAADDDLARGLEIVAMLRASGSAYAPDPEAKAIARRRLMARIAAERRDGALAPTAMEQTLPISDGAPTPTPGSRVSALRDESATEVTSRIAPIVDPAADAAADDAAVAVDHAETDDTPDTTHGRVRSRSRRAGRHTLPSRPARGAGSARPTRRARGGLRRLALTASAVLALVAIAGGGVFASRDALPGDSLYGIKRVAESAGIALTFDDSARAARHLELASTRLREVEQLVDQKRAEKADPALVKSTILDFDAATVEGTALLLTDDVAHDPAKLADLQAWAAEQVSRLSTMRSGLPLSAQAEADNSIEQLDNLRQRAAQLQERAGCDDVTSGRTDAVGPVPASTDCEPAGTGRDGQDRRSQGGAPRADDDPSGTTTATPDGLLPGVLGGSPSATGTDENPSASSGTPPSSAINVPLPLPLLPPINLPPLLPGGKGITIGG